MDFKQNYFEIFNLPVAFDVDKTVLAERYRQLQRSVHPDKFVNAPAQEMRLAVQWASQVNEAFATLKDPLARAIYLLSLAGADMRGKENAQVEPAFLLEQIELREDLEDIEAEDDALPRLNAFKARVDTVSRQLEGEFAKLLAVDLEGAEQTALKMQFMVRLRQAAEQLEEKLLNY